MKKSQNYLARHDLFISYNHKDKSFVDFLVGIFESCGLKVFQDVSGLKVFDRLDASLKVSISQSRWLIAIVSPNYLQSYWCMFEALEAIQGQDVEQKFLPILVKYTPEDQSLDERFVLSALRDIDTQMTDFEAQIITLKAFELAPKLEKLQFLRSHLPIVFRQIHERIYPEFHLWNEVSVLENMQKIIHRIAPKSKYDLSNIILNFERLEAMPKIVPRLQSLPTIIWKTRVGRQTWKHKPIIVGNDVIVGSAGAHWNQSDSEDGIYCLDAETGAIKWFSHTSADANCVLVSKGLAITGCDNGAVLAVSVRDGSRRWEITLDGGVVGGPLKLNGKSMRRINEPLDNVETHDPILLVTYVGSIYILDLITGREIQKTPVGGTVIGQPRMWRNKLKEYVLVPTIEGSLMFFEYSDISNALIAIGGTSIRYADKFAHPNELDFAEDGYSIATLAAEPVVAGHLILQGLVRKTYYSQPPLIALEGLTHEVEWVGAGYNENDEEGFGNLRSAPAIIGNEVIFAPAYSDSLYALSLNNGQLQWSVKLSQGMFEQWSTPIAVGKSVYLGRHDGYLHKIDTERKLLEWSIYLGAAEHAGMVVSGEQNLPEFDNDFDWSAAGSSPIVSTPTIDRGRLYVGSFEGFLYAIGNLGKNEST